MANMIIKTLKSNCIYCKRELYDSEEQYHIECHNEVITYQNRPFSILDWLYEHSFTGSEEDLLNLKRLILYNSQLSSLPKEIGQLKKLVVLDLSYNQLVSLPKEIGQLKQLEELYLSGNQLSSLPKEIGQLKQLKRLYLHYNSISQKKLTRIKRLLPKTEIYT